MPPSGLISADDALRFLSDASTDLANALQGADLVEWTTRLVVPRLGDWCVLHTFDDHGATDAIGVRGATDDEATRAALKEAAARPAWRARLDAALLATRPAIAVDAIVDDGMDGVVTRANTLLQPLARMVAPLRARGRLLGSLELFTTRASNRRYGSTDTAVVGDVASRVGLALDNARLLLTAVDAHDRAVRAQTIAEDAERASAAAQRAAEHANALKDLLLASISHELRTPVATILLWEHMLRAPATTEAARQQALDGIRVAAELQTRLVDDLLDVSRGIAGKLVLDRAPVDLGEVAQSEVDLARPAAFERGVQVTLTRAPEVGVVGDPLRLRQVVANLISNSLAFTRPRGRIEVRVERSGERARIVVDDDGAGIDPAFLPRVFEPFAQSDVRSTRGLGVGLAIVKKIVELHDGTVRATSGGHARGARFEVELPAVSLTPAQRRPHVALPAPGSLAGVRVLLVDDDALVRGAIAALLTHIGAEVREVHDADEALEIAREAPPDVLLTDLVMPGRDGCALLAELRARFPQLPAIAISAMTGERVRARAADAGFAACLTKPLDPHRLVATIGAAVAH